MDMKLIRLIALSFFCLNPLDSQAVTIQEFCEGFISINPSESRASVPLVQALQMMFMPRTMVSPSRLDEEKWSRFRSEPGVIYVNLPDPQIDFSKHAETLKKLDESRIAVAKLKLYRDLKTIHDQASCESRVAHDPDQFKVIQVYLDGFMANQPLMNQIQEKKSRKLLLNQLKPFVKKGWSIRFPVDHQELASQVDSDTRSEQIMLVSHADSLGRIYDASHQTLPKGFFSNLPTNISRVIQYSCYSRQVAEYYQIPNIKKRLDYVFPKVRDSLIEYFSDRTPVMAIRGMLKLGRLGLSSDTRTQDCTLELDLTALPEGMIVSINDQVIAYTSVVKGNRGHSHHSIPFYCDLLSSDKTMIKVFYLDSSMSRPLGLFRMALVDGSGKNHLLDVKEFLSSDRKRHLLTLGTLGGPL